MGRPRALYRDSVILERNVWDRIMLEKELVGVGWGSSSASLLFYGPADVGAPRPGVGPGLGRSWKQSGSSSGGQAS